MPMTKNQDLYDWMDQCQREDAPWIYEDGPRELPRTPVRGKGGKPTGEFLPSGRESVAIIDQLHGGTKMARAKNTRRDDTPTEGPDMDLNRQQRESAAAILAPLDAVASSMERKWGVGRLQTLIPTEWADKFDSARQKLNLAIDKLDLVALRERAEIMRRGWIKLDELATAAGHQDFSAADVWEVTSPAGRIYAIARTAIDEKNYTPDKDVRVITMEEVARIIDTWDADGFVTEMRSQFPGATIVKAGKPKTEEFEQDDIPY